MSLYKFYSDSVFLSPESTNKLLQKALHLFFPGFRHLDRGHTLITEFRASIVNPISLFKSISQYTAPTM